jgi:hypothetical protein
MKITPTLLFSFLGFVGNYASGQNLNFAPQSSASTFPGLTFLETSTKVGTVGTSSGGLWSTSASGGLRVAALGLAVATSQAQTVMTSDSLVFKQNSTGLVGDLTGASVPLAFAWSAQGTFSGVGGTTPAFVQPNQAYDVSFNIDTNNGLLSDVVGVGNSLSVSILDGNTVIHTIGTGSLIDIVGLLGGGVDGLVNYTFTTASAVSGQNLGIRISATRAIGVDALSIGEDFATFSNISVTPVPVPEPGVSLLSGLALVSLGLRRRRSN